MRFPLFTKAIAIGMIIAILCVALARMDALVGRLLDLPLPVMYCETTF
jgi:hypothetical protein